MTEVTIPGPVAHGPRGLALSVHGHLRRLILNGDLATGTVLNQAELARILGVSRTPMREAFRMLQEEGLIHAEPDRKAVVTGLDLDDLDAMYGARILLEALAVRMTVAAGGAAAAPVLDRALTRMRELRDERHTSPEWRGAHDEFHRVSTSGADAQLRRLLVMLRDRTHPYLRLAQSSSPDPEHGHAERRHQAIVAAFANEDTAAAATAMAEDLAATARRVVGDADPGRELPAVRHALSMLRGERI